MDGYWNVQVKVSASTQGTNVVGGSRFLGAWHSLYHNHSVDSRFLGAWQSLNHNHPVDSMFLGAWQSLCHNHSVDSRFLGTWQSLCHNHSVDSRFLGAWQSLSHNHPVDSRFLGAWQSLCHSHPFDSMFLGAWQLVCLWYSVANIENAGVTSRPVRRCGVGELRLGRKMTEVFMDCLQTMAEWFLKVAQDRLLHCGHHVDKNYWRYRDLLL